MSSPYPHLASAPITEALVDIQVEPCSGLTLGAFETFAAEISSDFPESRNIQHLQAHIAVDGDSPGIISAPPQTSGRICWSADKSRAVQARLNGFTLNHVKSYAGWATLEAQAKELWHRYVEVARPERVVRCALRYINRVEAPVNVDLSTQLRTRPEVSRGLPQLLDEYFMRLVVPFEGGRRAAITEATEPFEDGAPTRGLVLDIDVFVMKTLQPMSDDLWAEFSALRTIKNKCFFESLEQKTWETYR